MNSTARKHAALLRFIGILCAIFISLPGAAFADRGSDLQDELNSSQEEIQRANEDITQGKTEQAAALDQIREIDRRAVDLAVEIQELKAELTAKIGEKAQAENRLASLEVEIAEAAKVLAKERARLSEKKRALNDRVLNIYKTRRTSYLDVLLNSSTFGHFLNRLAFLRIIVEQDGRLVRQVKQTEAKVAETRRRQDEDKQALEKNKALIEADAGRISDLKAIQEETLAALRADKAEKQSLLSKLQKDQVALATVREQAEANARAIQELIRQWNAERASNSSRGDERGGSDGGYVWSPGVDTATAAAVRQAVEEECARQGINPEPVLEIVERESGGDPYAVNLSSGAAGLFQRVPGSLVVLGDIPGQVRDGVTYIKNRYGTSEAALAWWDEHGWY
ncbi:MAG: aggregation-promoting factor C-terminal-like domain-containing protein [Candidatus Aquicultorales bacterium]